MPRVMFLVWASSADRPAASSGRSASDGRAIATTFS